jgi:hypothetical protein
MTREEREEAYKIARERIFGSSEKPAEIGIGSPLDTSMLRRPLIYNKIPTTQMEFLAPVPYRPKISLTLEREGR